MEISELIKEARRQGKAPAFSYDRVSTQEQASTGSSLEYQSEHAKRYAEKNGLCIIRYFSAAESAFSEGRAVFNDMLTLADKYGIKDLIFKNSDRLARNDLDHARVKKLARKSGYRIHYYELSTVLESGSTAESEMFIDNTAVMARYWSNKISQSVKAANRYKAQKGVPPGRPPFGYVFDYEKKTFKIDEATSSKLWRIFDSYDIDNKSIQVICDEMTAAGESSPKGHKWRKAHMAYILSNPVYAGFFFDTDGYEHAGTYPAYITRERYEERRHKMRIHFNGDKKRSTDFLFSGLVRYANTGRLLTGEMHKGRVYYGHRNPNVMFSEDQIAAAIRYAAMQYAYARRTNFKADSDIIKEANKMFDEMYRNREPLKKSLAHKIENCISEERRLIRLYGKELITEEVLFAEVEKVKSQRMEHETKLDAVKSFDITAIEEFIDSVTLFYDSYSMPMKGVVASLGRICSSVIINDDVKKIKVDADGFVSVPGKSPDFDRVIHEMRFETIIHEDYITPQILELTAPYAARLTFKKSYAPFFEAVRESQDMLPALATLRTAIIETMLQIAR